MIARKYHEMMLQRDVKVYIKRCNVCLASKTVYHKPYSDLQSLPILTYWWKDLSIDFVTGFQLSTDRNSKSYNSILIIVDQLTKMIHYKSVKVTIDTIGLLEIIINIVIRHHKVLISIVMDWGSFFISKFWSSLYYF